MLRRCKRYVLTLICCNSGGKYTHLDCQLRKSQSDTAELIQLRMLNAVGNATVFCFHGPKGRMNGNCPFKCHQFGQKAPRHHWTSSGLPLPMPWCLSYPPNDECPESPWTGCCTLATPLVQMFSSFSRLVHNWCASTTSTVALCWAIPELMNPKLGKPSHGPWSMIGISPVGIAIFSSVWEHAWEALLGSFRLFMWRPEVQLASWVDCRWFLQALNYHINLGAEDHAMHYDLNSACCSPLIEDS